MTARRRCGRAPVAIALAVLTACGTPGDTLARDQSSGDGPSPSTIAPTRLQPTQEAEMQIEIRIGDARITATVDDTPAGRDLVAQLPQTVEMNDHGGVEKTGPLRAPLSLDGQPEGADPDPGDLGYYAPGNDLVLYYGDQSYYPGIVILGRLDGAAASRLAAMAGTISATVSSADAL
jgi:hypothetical protein